MGYSGLTAQEAFAMQGTLGSLNSLAGRAAGPGAGQHRRRPGRLRRDGRLTLLSPALQELFGMAFEPVSEDVHVERFHLFAGTA